MLDLDLVAGSIASHALSHGDVTQLGLCACVVQYSILESACNILPLLYMSDKCACMHKPQERVHESVFPPQLLPSCVQDKAKDGGDVGVQQAQEPPTVEYPDTTESEATLDSHHSDHGTFEVHEASRSNSGAEDVGPADDSVAHVEDGLSKVSLNDQ